MCVLIVDCTPGVAFRVLVVRKVNGHRALLRRAAVLSSGACHEHHVERVAEQMDQ